MMRHLFLAMLLSAAASAQQPARVTGRVVDQSGAPIRRANVTLFGVESHKGLTDNNGAFTIDSVAPGRYSLTAEAPGFAKQKYGAPNPLPNACVRPDPAPTNFQRCSASAPGATLSLASGQELKDIVIPLVKLGSISGRLTDQDGDPAPRWYVETMIESYDGGKRQILTSFTGEGRPDPEGNFTISNLPPGRYYLYAWNNSRLMLPSRFGRQPKASETDLPTYFPSEADPSRAVAVDVGPGAELHGMDIRLRRSRVYSISGSVTAPPDSGPLDHRMLSISRKGVRPGDINLSSPSTDPIHADGTFEFRNLEPGTYVLRSGGLMGPDPPAALFTHGEATISSADVEGFALTMIPEINLPGAFRLEDGSTADWPVVSLVNLDDLTNSPSSPPQGSGAFTFARGLDPSTYRVHFSHLPTGTYLKSIRYGNQDAIHAPLDLTGGGGGTLDILLSSKVATVSGDVKKAGVVVTVWPRIPELDGGVKSVSTDQDGHFEISDLGPGDYYLAAWEEIDHDLLQAPTFLARFQSEVSTITVEEGARVSADAKLITRERVAAEVAKLP
jgi:hypothetical protein